MDASVPKQKHEDQGVQPGNCSKMRVLAIAGVFRFKKKKLCKFKHGILRNSCLSTASTSLHCSYPLLLVLASLPLSPKFMASFSLITTVMNKQTDTDRKTYTHTQYIRSIQHYSYAHLSRTDHSRLNNLRVHSILLSEEQREVSVKYKPYPIFEVQAIFL